MSSGIGNLASGIGALIRASSNVGEYVFFKLVSDYLDDKIALLGSGIMERAMHGVALVALSLMTIWIMMMGYQIVTGTFRGGMSSLVTDSTKKVVIISIAASMSLFGQNLSEFFTVDMDRTINYLVTGEQSRSTASAIDENLAYTQVAFTAIDAVQVVGADPEVQKEKANALLFAGFGTSSPALVAGAMLIFFKLVLAFFVGLAPIFILLSMFQSTKSMFQRWLQYGIATLFAMAGLNAVTSIVLEMSTKIAFGFWGAKAINGIIGADPEGLSTQAMQQGWMGLILTAVLISVPSALAAFFGGLAGSFSAYPLVGGDAGRGVPGQRPGEPGYRGAAAPNSSPPQEDAPSGVNTHANRVAGHTSETQPDAVKTGANIRRDG